jgi:hypothetical protein
MAKTNPATINSRRRRGFFRLSGTISRERQEHPSPEVTGTTGAALVVRAI